MLGRQHAGFRSTRPHSAGMLSRRRARDGAVLTGMAALVGLVLVGCGGSALMRPTSSAAGASSTAAVTRLAYCKLLSNTEVSSIFKLSLRGTASSATGSCDYRTPSAPSDAFNFSATFTSPGGLVSCNTLMRNYAKAPASGLAPGEYELAANIGGYAGFLVSDRTGRYAWVATSGDTCLVLWVAGSRYLRQINSARAAALLNERVSELMNLAMPRAKTSMPAPGP